MTRLSIEVPRERCTPTLDRPTLDEALPANTRVALHDTLLPQFGTNLLVQAKLSEATEAAALTRHAQVGVVLTMEHKGYKRPLHKLSEAVAIVREDGSAQDDILVDRNLYSGSSSKDRLFGDHRKSAQDGLSRLWVEDQLFRFRLKIAVTDSGYCPTLADVRRVLRDAAPFPPGTLTLLPVPFELVRDEAAALAALINNHPHPAAIVLQHEADPFDEDGLAAGCVHLIASCQRPPVFLRTDTSALGLIAHGAAAAAIGTHSEYRHLFPVRDGNGVAEKLAFVIPELLGYYTQQRFGKAYLADASLQAWRCPCWFCGGRDLAWIDAQPKALKTTAAFQHSGAAIADLGTRFLTNLATGATGPAAWDTMCGSAQAAHDTVSNPSGSPWEPKPALKQWRSLARPITVT